MIPIAAISDSIYWHFPVLIVTVSLVYSATRFEQWNHIFQEALFWGARMTGFLAMIGIGLYLVTILEWWLSLTIAAVVALVLMFLSLRVTDRPRPSDHERVPPVTR